MIWDNAAWFCRDLSALPEERPAGRAYRLPTEAEWEYACRAGSTTTFSFGDNPTQLGQYAWFRDNSGGTTHPVGENQPNNWGLYDMHGNVWEWCQDLHGDYTPEAVVDPQGPPAPPAELGTLESLSLERVARGGSFSLPAWCCASWDRFGFSFMSNEGLRMEGKGDFGFRVVLVLSDK